jgi:hypothetical protein
MNKVTSPLQVDQVQTVQEANKRKIACKRLIF